MKLDSLQRQVTEQDVTKFLQVHMGKKPYYVSPKAVGVSSVIAGAVFLSLFLFADSSITYFFGGAILAVVGLVLIVLIVEKVQERRNATLGSRLEWMAADNNWTYRFSATSLGYPGSLFALGHSRRYDNIVSGPDFDAGKYTYSTGSGKNRQTYHYGFVALKLKKSMPHMLLDTKSNNTKFFGRDMSNLPMSFSKDQKVSLEGDFDKYYNLYAPKDYGVDVRYVFTPELMELLIKESADDMEIIDDMLFVYSTNSNIESEAFWHKVERFRNVLGAKLVARAGRYDDDRTVDSHSVAPEGKRLKKGVSIATIALIILYLLSFLLETVGKLQD